MCSNLFLVTKRPAFPTTMLGPHCFPCPVKHLQFATSNVQSIILLSFFSQSIFFPPNGDIFSKGVWYWSVSTLWAREVQFRWWRERCLSKQFSFAVVGAFSCQKVGRFHSRMAEQPIAI